MNGIDGLVWLCCTQEQFDQAAGEVKKFTTRPNNDELLELYGLFKQATAGDNTTSQPWAIQIEASSKWNAWTKNKGLSQDAAKEKYIELVKQLTPKYK
jgi:diazepam-binding inhibitor (GABA receptor modulating acyl-CoA-binding protein)